MSRFTWIVLVILWPLLCGCEDLYPPCPKTRAEIDVKPWSGIQRVACSCTDERKQDLYDHCCNKNGGACEGEDVPTPQRSWTRSSGPLYGIRGFQVRGLNKSNPDVCEPLYAEWAYVNLQDTMLRSAAEIHGLELPAFELHGPFAESSPGVPDGANLRDRIEAPFGRIARHGELPVQLSVEGQQEGNYTAGLVNLLPYTPGTSVQTVWVHGTDGLDLSGEEGEGTDEFDCW